MVSAKEKLATRKKEGRLLNFRPVFSVALFLSIGIALGYFLETAGISPWWTVLAICALFFVAFVFKKGVLTVLFFLLALSFGVVSSSYTLSEFRALEFPVGVYTVRGRVAERGFESDGAQVRFDSVTLNGVRVEGVLVSYLPASLAQNLSLADTVVFTAKVEENTKLFSEYGFRAEAISEGRRFYASGITEFSVTGRRADWFLEIREKITRSVQAGMSEDAAAVTLAVLLGDTTGIDGELLDNIRNGGIAHIFAVSGLHIGTLFGVVSAFFEKGKLRKLPRFLRLLAVGGALVVYGGVCGYSASVVRAIVVCLSGYLIKTYGGKTDGVETVSFAAACILVFKPMQLFAVGFQLSFLACYGIAFLQRPISKGVQKVLVSARAGFCEKVLKRPIPKPDPFALDGKSVSVFTQFSRFVSGFVSVSLGAQIFTFPVLLLRFGGTAELGLLLNLLFVPFLSVGFCPLLVFVLASACFAGFESLILALPSALLSTVILPFELLALRSVSLDWFSQAGTIVLYYACAFCLSDKCGVAKRKKVVLFSLLFLSLAVSIFA